MGQSMCKDTQSINESEYKEEKIQESMRKNKPIVTEEIQEYDNILMVKANRQHKLSEIHERQESAVSDIQIVPERKLLIEVSDPQSKEVFQKVEIGENGSVNGRAQDQGKVVFGLSEFDEAVDVELSCAELTEKGKFFEVFFENKTSQFILKDLGVGLGTYVKLYSPMQVEGNCMINIGQTFVVAEVVDLQDKSMQNYTKYINETSGSDRLLSEQSIRLSVFNQEDKSSKS